jgi:SAM-dependent methyltransferase
MVAGTADPRWFIESGRETAAMIEACVQRHGVAIDQIDHLLDFGCGCGRVTRHWAAFPSVEVHGSDFNARAVEWCRRSLSFASFAVNELAPPLVYDDEAFDVVYAISVFTHLPEELQQAWCEELQRALRPGGLALLTTHGDAYLPRLSPDERARYSAGELVVRWSEVAGTNLCTTFHPLPYIQAQLARGWETLEIAPKGAAAGSPDQDLLVFRKPA